LAGEIASLALTGETSGPSIQRLISAVAGDFADLPPRIAEIMGSEAYALRRGELGP